MLSISFGFSGRRRYKTRVRRYLKAGKDQWGLVILGLHTLWGTIKFLQYDFAFHYAAFAGPGPMFWAGKNPYGLSFLPETFVGMPYLYSPSFSMFVFYPFSLLPDFWGRLAYILVSLALFFGGLVYLLRSLEKTFGFSWLSHPWRNWISFIVGSELFGAIVYCKWELPELGIVLFCVRWLIEGKVFWPAFVLGLVGETKFQTIPLIGLCIVVCYVAQQKPVRFLLSAAAGFAFFALLPLLAFTPTALIEANLTRFAVLDAQVAQYWKGPYQHVFKFFLTAGIPLTLQQLKAFSIMAGAVMAVWLFVVVDNWKRRSPAPYVASLGFLSAAALGLIYLVLFSPLSQTNAYVFFVPLFLLAVSSHPQGGKSWHLVSLLACFFLVCGFYSDLVPKAWSLWAREWGMKPWGIIPLFLISGVGYLRSSKISLKFR